MKQDTRMKTPMGFIMVMIAVLVFPACVNASDHGSSAAEDTEIVVEPVTEGLQRPWSLAFLPADWVSRTGTGGESDLALVTERTGRLNLVNLADGSREQISGLPAIATPGRGGLLDVVLHPEFAGGEQNWVYITYVTQGSGGYAMTLGRGRLDLRGRALTEFEQLLVATPYDSGNHYGGRMVFDDAGYLYVTSGDRQVPHRLQERHPSQDLQSYHGKTLRLNADGSIPASNPFVGNPDALDAIYTYGHRNHQGMAIHPETGDIWQNEHGEGDGDEINVLRISDGSAAGSNYGWPIASYGRDYRSGAEVGVLPPENPDTVNPVHWWERGDDGGFPPSGMAFYMGDAFPAWRGHMLMGNLADQYLARFEIDNFGVVDGRSQGHEHEYRLLEGRGWRIRDVRVHPDTGYIYVLVDANSAPLVRLRPQD